jgi:hypothetical protein
MKRASNNGENRIHLGTEYNKDDTMETGTKMLEGAMMFDRYIEYLLDHKVDWYSLRSRSHTYLVAKDSLLNTTEINIYFSKLNDIYKSMIDGDPTITYVGTQPSNLYEQIEIPSYLNQSYFQGAFSTVEHSISFGPVRKMLIQKLSDKHVDVVLNTHVNEVIRNGELNDKGRKKFTVVTNSGKHYVDFVVNALWEGRYSIDKSLGWSWWNGNNLRLKFGINSQPISQLKDLPSLSIVNGPFGDFAHYDKEGRMYFCWYPEARFGMRHDQDLEPPEEWQSIVNGTISKEVYEQQISTQEQNFNSMFLPGVDFQFSNPSLTGNYIVGNGRHDVDDSESGLHKRVGHPIKYEDGYWSLSTQKFTTAPWNTRLLEETYLKITS